MALACEPGNVDQLSAALKKAVGMGEDEYRKRSLISKESLSSYLVPMKFYPEQYRMLLQS
jgi:hypothetical protein